MEYEGDPISSGEAECLYESANEETLNKAFQTVEPREYEQLSIMKRLNKIVYDLKFKRIRK